MTIYVLTVIDNNGAAIDYEFDSKTDRLAYYKKLRHSAVDKIIKAYTFSEIEKEG